MLSQRETDALAAIERLTESFGYSPTIREVQEAIGHSSPSATYNTLSVLRDQGLVTWVPNTFRTLRVVRRGA